jgi:flagellar assembly protein FliH
LEGQRLIKEYADTQGKESAATFASLFDNVTEQLAQAEQVMAHGVLELACELARQVLRHELSTNPNALQPVVREALGMLAVDSKAAVVRLNPLDMEVLAEVLRQEFSNLALTLLPDATLARGGCLVESAGTVVDATVEKRWLRAVSSVGLGAPWESEDGND